MKWLQQAASTVGGFGRTSLAGGAALGRKGQVISPEKVRNSGYMRMGAAGGGALMLSRRDSSARRGGPAPRSSGGAGYPPGHSMGGMM